MTDVIGCPSFQDYVHNVLPHFVIQR